MARQCHRLTRADKLERVHNGEAVICRYRVTATGHACADLVAEPPALDGGAP